MLINDIQRMDSVVATVSKAFMGGALLNIDELDDAVPKVKLYDSAVCNGDKLLVSIRKVSDDRSCIKTALDSIISPYCSVT